jgi:hypothetical protein
MRGGSGGNLISGNCTNHFSARVLSKHLLNLVEGHVDLACATGVSSSAVRSTHAHASRDSTHGGTHGRWNERTHSARSGTHSRRAQARAQICNTHTSSSDRLGRRGTLLVLLGSRVLRILLLSRVLRVLLLGSRVLRILLLGSRVLRVLLLRSRVLRILLLRSRVLRVLLLRSRVLRVLLLRSRVLLLGSRVLRILLLGCLVSGRSVLLTSANRTEGTLLSLVLGGGLRVGGKLSCGSHLARAIQDWSGASGSRSSGESNSNRFHLE